jgi:hypothetical protein
VVEDGASEPSSPTPGTGPAGAAAEPAAACMGVDNPAESATAASETAAAADPT